MRRVWNKGARREKREREGEVREEGERSTRMPDTRADIRGRKLNTTMPEHQNKQKKTINSTSSCPSDATNGVRQAEALEIKRQVLKSQRREEKSNKRQVLKLQKELQQKFNVDLKLLAWKSIVDSVAISSHSLLHSRRKGKRD